jgi:hypothetical protein
MSSILGSLAEQPRQEAHGAPALCPGSTPLIGGFVMQARSLWISGALAFALGAGGACAGDAQDAPPTILAPARVAQAANSEIVARRGADEAPTPRSWNPSRKVDPSEPPADEVLEVAEIAAEPEAPVALAPPTLRVLSATLARRVSNREPVGKTTVFEEGTGNVWAWARIENLGEESEVSFVWKREGEERGRIALKVGHSDGWRTYSRKLMAPEEAGRWTAEIVDVHGNVLETLPFQLGEGNATVAATR